MLQLKHIKQGRGKKQRPMTVVRSMGNAVPDKMRVILPYADIFATGSLNVGTTTAELRLNSTFAPVNTGWLLNTQPYGRDQFAALYRRYLVHRIRLICNTSVIAGAALYICNSVYPNALTANTVKAAAEQSKAFVRPYSQVYTSPPIEYDSGWVDLAALNGRTPAEYRANDSLYGAGVGASPTSGSYHAIHFQEANANATTGNASVIIWYDVEFYDRDDFAAS